MLTAVHGHIASDIREHELHRQRWETRSLGDDVLEWSMEPLRLLFTHSSPSMPGRVSLYVSRWDEDSDPEYYVIVPRDDTEIVSHVKNLLQAIRETFGKAFLDLKAGSTTDTPLRIVTGSMDPVLKISVQPTAVGYSSATPSPPHSTSFVTVYPETYGSFMRSESLKTVVNLQIDNNTTKLVSGSATLGTWNSEDIQKWMADDESSSVSSMSSVDSLLSMMDSVITAEVLQRLQLNLNAVERLSDEDMKHFYNVLSRAPVLEEVDLRADKPPTSSVLGQIFSILWSRTNIRAYPSLRKIRIAPFCLHQWMDPMVRFIDYRCRFRLPVPREMIIPLASMYHATKKNLPHVSARRLALGRVDVIPSNNLHFRRYLFDMILADQRTRLVCIESGVDGIWPRRRSDLDGEDEDEEGTELAQKDNRGRHFHVIIRRVNDITGLRRIVVGCSRVTLRIELDPTQVQYQPGVQDDPLGDISDLLISLLSVCQGDIRVAIQCGFAFTSRTTDSGNTIKNMRNRMWRLIYFVYHHTFFLHPNTTRRNGLHILLDMSDPTENGSNHHWFSESHRSLLSEFRDAGSDWYWIKEPDAEVRQWISKHVKVTHTVNDHYHSFLQMPDDLSIRWPFH